MIEPIYLIAGGVVLIALEAVITSFIVVWFGLAMLITGGIGYAIELNLEQQVISISVLGMALLLTMKTTAYNHFMKAKDGEVNDNFFDEEGFGVINGEKVLFKSVYFSIPNPENFAEGEKVKVLSASSGKATVEKL